MQQNIFLKGVAYTFACQVASRIIPFVLSTVAVRYLKPSDYAVSSFQFQLLVNLILQPSREGFRRGLIRASQQQEYEVLQLAAIIPLIGIIFTIIATAYFILTTGQATLPYILAVLLHGLGCLIELIGEPVHILAQVRSDFRVEFMIEFLATLLSRCSTLLLIAYEIFSPIISFSIGELIFGSVTCMGYLLYAALIQIHKISSKQQTENTQCVAFGILWTVDRKLYGVSLDFTWQAIQKLLLSEGSKYVLMSVDTQQSQGVYGLVSNLGSLIVRMLFWPIERASFIMFSQMKDSKQDQDAQSLGLNSKQSQYSHIDPSRNNSKNIPNQESQNNSNSKNAQLANLGLLVKVASFIGFLGVALGPNYSHTILHVLYGPKWSDSDAPNVLSLYCMYLALIAINGVTESFSHAVMDRISLQRSNNFMLAISIVHIGVSFLLIQNFGGYGLIFAEGINMGVRIIYSLIFIQSYFNVGFSFLLSGLFPNFISLLAVVVGHFLTRQSLLVSKVQFGLQSQIIHIGVGGLVMVFVSVAFILLEDSIRKRLQFYVNKFINLQKKD